MPDGAWVYILRCADGAFYVGTTRGELEKRVAEHNAASFGGWTARRRPVALAWSQWFVRITDAIAAERQLKTWSRGKKDALVRSDFPRLKALAVSNSAPVISALSGPHRKTINAATFAAGMNRPLGCFPDSTRCSAWFLESPSVSITSRTLASWTGVSVVPGHTALQVMLCPRVSSATARVIPRSAVLVVT